MSEGVRESFHTLEETVDATARKSIPTWYMVATEDKTLNSAE